MLLSVAITKSKWLVSYTGLSYRTVIPQSFLIVTTAFLLHGYGCTCSPPCNSMSWTATVTCPSQWNHQVKSPNHTSGKTSRRSPRRNKKIGLWILAAEDRLCPWYREGSDYIKSMKQHSFFCGWARILTCTATECSRLPSPRWHIKRNEMD